ncbi:MAG TPA: HlyD family efflux transporter periplasmic adaptor subunit, partial [Acidobacteriota bacterium]|nr:HlyD family efflux transporter periplasmic adaptor subunit [Acidobacteriota bacterium]
MVKFLKILLALAFLAVGLFGAWSLISTRPQVESAAPTFSTPLVEVMPLSPRNIQLRVRTQGTVMPRTESSLVPEISGRVVYVSPSFSSGGFFEEDEVLLRIDPRDFELAIAEADARIAQARFQIEREQAEARVARREWEELGEGRASDLLLRTPQVAEAEAALEAAKASRELAQRNLSRTEIRAPYRGRVRSRSADIGQFVVQGDSVAQLYAVDFAEVRLPIPREELGSVNLPFHFRDGRSV